MHKLTNERFLSLKLEKKLFILSLRVLSLVPEFQVKDFMIMFIDFAEKLTT